MFINEPVFLLTEKVDEGDTASIKSNDSSKKQPRKVKQLRVLDGKMAQSLSILLGSVGASCLFSPYCRQT